MPKIQVRTGDTVMVISGKNKGKKGKVVSVQPDKSRVIVEDINVVKRHTKPTQKMPQGGIVEKEAPIHSSNVLLYCNKCNKTTRISKKFLEDGKKVRVCKQCGEVLG
ncbi:MAG: 50S ribosomal protein L24 [Peptococcaceae bacterium BRH_c4b]|nr:MAG: 50S ribosomal protein L24 [Peptococcaceae bacterium BRH_c4b]